MTTQKSREARLRRVAYRRGMLLSKCRRRDPLAIGYGTYQLTDLNDHIVACGADNEGFGMTLDEVEKFLNRK